ncbi:unnamed protein product, partial [Nesidiocoris tenuis]
TIPRGDIYVQYGNLLEIYCSLTRSKDDHHGRKYNSSNLFFSYDNDPVESNYVTIVNETTIKLEMEPPRWKKLMHCSLRLDDGTMPLVCLNYVFVGGTFEVPSHLMLGYPEESFIEFRGDLLLSSLVVYNITGLKYAHTLYDIRVMIKPTIADKSKWSAPATTTFHTNATGGSSTTSFDIHSIFHEIRPIFRYIMGLTGGSIADSSFRLDPAVMIPIALPEPAHFIKSSYDHGIWELNWKLDSSVTSYTIFWCDNKMDRPYECQLLTVPPKHIKHSDVTNSSMVLSWDRPTSLNGVLRHYILYWNNNSTKVENQSATVQYKLTSLQGYTDYLIKVQACTTACSANSSVILVKTQTGVPGYVDAPLVRFSDKTEYNMVVTWNAPREPGGDILHYDVHVKLTDGNSILKEKHYESKSLKLEIPTRECQAAGGPKYYIIQVRAVNQDEHGLLYGPWSIPGEGNCVPGLPNFKPFGMLIKLILVTVLSESRLYSKILNTLCSSGNLLLLDKKNKDEGQESSTEDCEESGGDQESSGCGSGHESVSSSITAGTHITDSGTEADEVHIMLFGNIVIFPCSFSACIGSKKQQRSESCPFAELFCKGSFHKCCAERLNLGDHPSCFQFEIEIQFDISFSSSLSFSLTSVSLPFSRRKRMMAVQGFWSPSRSSTDTLSRTWMSSSRCKWQSAVNPVKDTLLPSETTTKSFPPTCVVLFCSVRCCPEIVSYGLFSKSRVFAPLGLFRDGHFLLFFRVFPTQGVTFLYEYHPEGVVLDNEKQAVAIKIKNKPFNLHSYSVPQQVSTQVAETHDLQSVQSIKLKVMTKDLPLHSLHTNLPGLKELDLDSSYIHSLRYPHIPHLHFTLLSPGGRTSLDNMSVALCGNLTTAIAHNKKRQKSVVSWTIRKGSRPFVSATRPLAFLKPQTAAITPLKIHNYFLSTTASSVISCSVTLFSYWQSFVALIS